MSLGANNQICKDAYIAAMRARLAAEDPALEANVDLEGVQKNFGALAEALFQILTTKAEVSSAAAADPAFWQWVTSMVTWAQAMSAWQSSLRTAFQGWAPVNAPDQAFRTAVLGLTSPGAPPAAPASLKGKIQ